MNEVIDINIDKICAINEFRSSNELKFKHRDRRWDGFVYFDEAEGLFIPDGEEPVEIKNSTLIFLNVRDSYSIYLKSGYRYISSAYKLIRDERGTLSALARRVICSKSEGALISSIYRTWCENGRYSAMDCKIQILSLYLGFIKRYFGTDEKNDTVKRAVDFIHANFRRNFSTEEIAAFCGISESHLRALFRKSTGTTILGYREEQRVIEAKRMLSTSLFALKEISYELGYSDVYHFSKAFKKATGFTPGKYKKQG